MGAGPRGFGTGLGSIGSRVGRFEYDSEAMNRANAELAKMNSDLNSALPGEEKKEEGQSFQDLMKAKREKTEKFLDSEKNKQETMEERKARLQAQRDLLRKLKEEKR